MEIKKRLYDHIANEYHNMSKEELKSYALEALYQLSEYTTDDEYDECCEMIYDAVNPEEETYSIVRFFRDLEKESEIIKTGLTLAEAKEHCSKEETKTEEWFDGFQKE